MYEGPCTRCDFKGTCIPYKDLSKDLFHNTRFQRGSTLDAYDQKLDEITLLWIRSVAENTDLWMMEDVIASIPALFDTLCSSLYALEAVTEGSRQKPGLRCRDELIFPFTWMCPRCVSRRRPRTECYLPDARRETRKGITRDYPNVKLLAKPQARSIGDVGFKVLMSLLRVTLKFSPYAISLNTGGGKRGEFDLTMTSDDLLVFGEVKAKPLIAFPLVLRGYFPDDSVDHEWTKDYSLEDRDLALYVAASDFFIPLEPRNNGLWPLESLTLLANNPQQIYQIISGWRKHLTAYRVWRGEPDELRWHRFGCGNFRDSDGVERRVANTKELPGLDRTDDIKKGTTQVLKYSRFKLNCNKNALKSALLSNLYAETHGADYVKPLSNLQVKTPEASGYEWIFDMILGFSNNVFNDELLEDVFSTERIMDRVLKSV